MQKYLIYAIMLLMAGGGTFITQKFEVRKLNKAHRKAITQCRDSLRAYQDSNATLRQNVVYLVKQDSLARTLVGEMQTTMLELRNIQITQQKRIVYLEKWKADAEDDGIITPDTLIYRKGIFGKLKRVL